MLLEELVVLASSRSMGLVLLVAVRLEKSILGKAAIFGVDV